MFRRKPKPVDAKPNALSIMAALNEDRTLTGLTDAQIEILNDAAILAEQVRHHMERAEKLVAKARNAFVYWKSTMGSAEREVAQSVIDDIDEWLKDGPEHDTEGGQALSLWFGLSRASFLVLPRVMMMQMSDIWAWRMAGLLEEFDAKWSRTPENIRFKVRGEGERGRLAKLPEAVTNYRHPRHAVLREWCREPINDWQQFCDAVRQIVFEYFSDNAKTYAEQQDLIANPPVIGHDLIVEVSNKVAMGGDPDPDRHHAFAFTWENAHLTAKAIIHD